jgi:hypothetical protein
MQRYRSIRWPVVIPLAFLLSLPCAAASAEERTSRARDARFDTEDGYGYIFSDDPMQAGAFTQSDSRIVVARSVVRTQLIRPRTAFVVQLLRSVEAL